MDHGALAQRAAGLLTSVRGQGLKLPGTVIFGSGELGQAGWAAEKLANGGTALLVTGGQSANLFGHKDRVCAILTEFGIETTPFAAGSGEPTVEMVDAGAARTRETQPGVVIGLGGGSVIDTAKAVAALATNPGSVEDYLEGVGRGWKVERPPLPFIAIPTTSGTGAEMTRNSVVGSRKKHFKKSMRDDRMVATFAIVDPELTLSVPPKVTAIGGLDTIAQLIEPCISVRRRSETTALALEALRHCRQSLPRAFRQPGDLRARENLAFASMFSGVCLANAGLALAHGIASGMGARHDLTHGLICGVMLPHTLRYNREACESELREALAAFLEVEADSGTIDRGIAALEELNRFLGVPPDFKHLQLADAELERIAEASIGNSLAGNPVPMDAKAVYEFLRTVV